ncbi:uncharacterized protein LOC127757035 [Oryza glaberrima]|uniref:Hypothetical_protein n=1 Tax=Oryza glaberrima TaxID=4538 RepID=G2XLC5_ORYGL|nr:uncharacterized protein LOC127757035 [Oryza glaberrima]CBX24384.1 hypothetical_protein [Oryza glaberrima]
MSPSSFLHHPRLLPPSSTPSFLPPSLLPPTSPQRRPVVANGERLRPAAPSRQIWGRWQRRGRGGSWLRQRATVAAGKGRPAAVAGDESGEELSFSLPPLPSSGRLRPLARYGGGGSGGEGMATGCGGGRRVRQRAPLLPPTSPQQRPTAPSCQIRGNNSGGEGAAAGCGKGQR